MNFAFNLLLSNCFLRQHNGKICAIPVTYSALSQLTQRFVYINTVFRNRQKISFIFNEAFWPLCCSYKWIFPHHHIFSLFFVACFLNIFRTLFFVHQGFMPLPAPLLDDSKYRSCTIQHDHHVYNRPQSCVNHASSMFSSIILSQNIGVYTSPFK